jgi:hypothetical protein
VAKERANKIEALVVEEQVQAIRQNLREKWDALQRLVQATVGPIPTNVTALKDALQEKSVDWQEIDQAVRATYETTIQLSDDELVQRFSKEFEEKKRRVLLAELNEGKKFVSVFSKFLSPEEYDKFSQLMRVSGMSEEEFRKSYGEGASYRGTLSKVNGHVQALLKQSVNDEHFRRIAYEIFPEETVEEKAKKELKNENGASDGKVTSIPEKNMPAYRNELRKQLQSKLKEIYRTEREMEREQLFAGEWSFMRIFYDELTPSRNSEE